MSKSNIIIMEKDLHLLDICIDILRNPNGSSALVTEGMCATLLILKERVKALDSPVLSLDITEEEYNQHFRDLFIEHDINYIRHLILPDL